MAFFISPCWMESKASPGFFFVAQPISQATSHPSSQALRPQRPPMPRRVPRRSLRPRRPPRRSKRPNEDAAIERRWRRSRVAWNGWVFFCCKGFRTKNGTHFFGGRSKLNFKGDEILGSSKSWNLMLGRWSFLLEWSLFRRHSFFFWEVFSDEPGGH